jgi:REP element-mobilizing transposase RayT
MPFNPDRLHRCSIRLRGYDYAQAGAYFITICTNPRAPFFDDAALRQIAQGCWEAIPEFNPGIELDEWVVMPNHLHGILILPAEQGVLSNAPTGMRHTWSWILKVPRQIDGHTIRGEPSRVNKR